MMITLEASETNLNEVLDRLSEEKEIVITREGRTVGTLTSRQKLKGNRRPGRGVGDIVILAEDDEHLKFFEEIFQ